MIEYSNVQVIPLSEDQKKNESVSTGVLSVKQDSQDKTYSLTINEGSFC